MILLFNQNKKCMFRCHQRYLCNQNQKCKHYNNICMLLW